MYQDEQAIENKELKQPAHFILYLSTQKIKLLLGYELRK